MADELAKLVGLLRVLDDTLTASPTGRRCVYFTAKCPLVISDDPSTTT